MVPGGWWEEEADNKGAGEEGKERGAHLVPPKLIQQYIVDSRKWARNWDKEKREKRQGRKRKDGGWTGEERNRVEIRNGEIEGATAKGSREEGVDGDKRYLICTD